MPYSSLVYRDLLPESDQGYATIIALHGNRGQLNDLVPLARSLGPDLHVVAPEAARGVYNFRQVIAHSWYGGWEPERPETVSFGDSLAQIERFIHDVRERDRGRNDDPPWLLGYEQGATLALAMALIAPDLIRGVIAISGGLPTFSDPTLLEPVAGNLPILLVGDAAKRADQEPKLTATADRLSQLGHRVTTDWVADAGKLGLPVTEAVCRWLVEQRQPAAYPIASDQGSTQFLERS